MPAPLDILLDQDGLVAEGLLRLGPGPGQGLRQLLVVLDLDHALAAAACRGLDHDGIGHLVLLHPGLDLLDVGDRVDARNGRHIGLLCQRLGLDLVPQQADDLGRRTDPGEARIDHFLRKFRVLRKESPARMDRIRLALGGSLDHLVHVEIGLGRRRVADVDGLVRHEHMVGKTVWVAVDCHGRDLPVPAGVHDPDRGDASVRNQDFTYFSVHRCPCTYQKKRPLPDE